jgi:chemotaxis protein MotB
MPRLTLIPHFLLLIIFSLSACVSYPHYTALEDEYKETRLQKDQAEQKIKRLELELEQMNNKLKAVDAERFNATRSARKCSRDLKKIRAQHEHLENLNKQMSATNTKLHSDLQRTKSVIVLQEKVIQLLDDTKKTIQSSLKDQIAAKEIEISETKEQLKMVLKDMILFESGKVSISENGKALLQVIANSIRENENQDIVVAGHTDNKPLSARLEKKYPSNWELSTARAAAVVRYLQQQGRIAPERLTVCGYSFHRPLASNETEEGRRQNRRIEIVVHPRQLKSQKYF